MIFHETFQGCHGIRTTTRMIGYEDETINYIQSLRHTTHRNISSFFFDPENISDF